MRLHARAMVSHGGTGTTRAGLAAGIPQVVLPLFADQPDNAARVDALGAGIAVQEGLTNALRYAAGAPVHVQVRRDEELTVEVTNGRAPRSEPQLGGGQGLPGLRARLAAQGGALRPDRPRRRLATGGAHPVGPHREP